MLRAFIFADSFRHFTKIQSIKALQLLGFSKGINVEKVGTSLIRTQLDWLINQVFLENELSSETLEASCRSMILLDFDALKCMERQFKRDGSSSMLMKLG